MIFTEAFVEHYSYITMALMNSRERNTISNRVVHISVQLLSPEGLACQMVEQKGLLYIMLGSLYHMITSIASNSDMNGWWNIQHSKYRLLLERIVPVLNL